ncbi:MULTISPECIES: hypothetical protein [Streptomyces]|uniref:Uncharacterized protein n=1 Tax=Streptomyces demainii TaxID=588122 RepID=A0ABT9KHN0_9ACTN|nr:MULTISPECIES: hypothetical protein [Streptomyces]MDP9607928.1 hypothetical protein [Streptomyces demainii]NUH41237.1 hypothetical protein [Streptomyces samsunensis]
MKLETKRWLLAPARQWRTHRLMAQQGPSLSYTTAWALVTLANSPEEFAFVQQSARETDPTVEAGLYFDDWKELSSQERDRRKRWLLRRGSSPVQQLGITEEAIKRAGMRVVDWGEPSGG